MHFNRRIVAVLGLVVVLATAVPASAAPRRDDDPFIRRIVQIVQQIKKLLPVSPTDDTGILPPKP